MLSIIVPVYNSEIYLHNCLGSLIGQTYTDLEIILVNDGSTDNSLEICHQFAAKDNRIKVLNYHHRGQSAARNEGLDCATGKYITFVDSDDELNLETYAGLIEYLEQNENIDVVQYPSAREYGTNKAFLVNPCAEIISGQEKLLNKMIVENKISALVWDKVYRKKILENLKFKIMIFEDNYFITELLTKIEKLAIVEHGLYFYYKRTNSITNSPMSYEKIKDRQKVNMKIYKLLQSFTNIPDSKVKVQQDILNCCITLSDVYQREFQIYPKKEINIWSLILSKTRTKQKLKLLFFKLFGKEMLLFFFNNKESLRRLTSVFDIKEFKTS